MSSVDERVVEMRFDNQQFESGVNTSLKTLDRLKTGLSNLDDSASSLTSLQTSADNLDISGIANGVDQITDRFSVLGIMADQTIRIITSGLVNIGVQAANAIKNLTLSPIAGGFAQYEQETKSVQTLMNATGLGMNEIEKYTKKLGFYVDETSYSYDSMFSTLASMMSSGVENINEGVDALIGLGNAAGLAGVDANQATHAFEGFGKAIGQGYMDTRTWSWLKTARMDTIALKDAFINAGVNAGTLVKEIDKNGDALIYVADSAGKANKKLGEINASNFENFLSQKWLKRDVMLEGVGKYSKAFEQIYSDYLKTGDYAEDIIDRLGDDLDEYSLKAFKAANQTRTFTDVIEYIGGAASRRWSTAFKKIFGNFEESSALWASLIDPMYELFITPLDNINDLLDNWRELGGYEQVVDGIQLAFEGLVNSVTVVKKAFNDVFPEVTADRIFQITNGIKTFSEKLSDSTSFLEAESGNIYLLNGTFSNLIRGFKGILSIISLVGKAFKTFFTSLSPTTNLLQKFGDRVVNVFGKFGQALMNINNSEKTIEFFNMMSERLINVQTKVASVLDKVNARFSEFVSVVKDDVIAGFKGLGDGLSLIWKGFKSFAQALSPISGLLNNIVSALGDFLFTLGVDFSSIFGNFGRFITELNNCNDASEMLANVQEKLSKVTENVINKFSNFKDVLKNINENVKQFIKINIGNSFKNIFKDFDISTLGKMFGGLGAVLAGVNFYRLFDDIAYHLKDFFNVGEKVKAVMGTIEDAFWSFGQNVSAGAILKIAGAIAILSGSLILLGSIDPKSLTQGLIAISILLAEVYAMLGLLSKPDGLKGFSNIISAFSENVSGMRTASNSILKMAAAVFILAAAVKMLSNIDSASIMNGIVAVGVLLGALTLSSILLSKYSEKMITGAAGMIGMAAAVLILTSAVKKLSSLDFASLAKGVGGVTALLVAFALFNNFGGNGGNMMGLGAGLLVASAALLVITSAIKKLGSLDLEFLAKGIGGIAAILAAFALFNNFGGNSGNMIGLGAGLLIASAALVVMASSVKKLGSLDLESLAKGIGGIAAVLVAFALFNNFGGNAGNMIGLGAGLLIASAALEVIVSAVKKLGSLDLASLAKGVGGIAAILAAFALFNQFGGGAINMVGMAAGVLIMAVSLTALVPALLALGAASGTAVTGILLLIGIFTVLGVAATLLSPVIIPILALSAALLAISASIAVAGAGLLLLSAGMTAFAGSLAISVAEIVAAVDTLLLGLASIAASVVVAVAAIVTAIALGFAEAVPTVVASVLLLILGIINALAEYAPQIAAAGAQLIIGLLDAIATYVGPLTEAGLNLIISLINGMANAVEERGNDLLDAFGNLLAAIIGFLGEAIARLVSLIPGVGDKMADMVRKGTDAIKSELTSSDLGNAGENAANELVEGASSVEGDMQNAGELLGNSMIEGFKSTEGDVPIAAENIGDIFVDGIISKEDDVEHAGEILSLSSIQGLNSNNGLSSNAGINIGNSAIGGFSTLIDNFKYAGSAGGRGLVNGILSMVGEASNAGKKLGYAAARGAKEALEVKSPSRVFRKIGEFAAEGFCNGVSSMLSDVTDSTKELGDVAIDSVANSLQGISDVIDSDIDTQPVITPVLDLTNIKGQAQTIDSLLSSSTGVALSGVTLSGRLQSTDIQGKQLSDLLLVEQEMLKEIQNENRSEPKVFNPTINIYPQKGQSPDEIASLVEKRLAFAYNQRKAAGLR